MKNKSCATNFATQQPYSLLLLLQELFLLAERKKMCYLSMAANQNQYTNINSFILGYIYTNGLDELNELRSDSPTMPCAVLGCRSLSFRQ